MVSLIVINIIATTIFTTIAIAIDKTFKNLNIEVIENDEN